jgi:flagellar assembly protein FliH
MAAVLAPAVLDIHRWVLPNVGVAGVTTKSAPGAQPTVRELAALEQQAREEGRAAGHAEGLAAAQQQIKQRLAQLDALYEAAARPLLALDEQTEQELARLTIVIARRVLASELKLSPELIVQAVHRAAAALPAAARELRVHLHPADLALLRELGTAESHWQLIADATLARGGCQLESARSHLDASIETQLAAVIDAVLGDDASGAEAGA